MVDLSGQDSGEGLHGLGPFPDQLLPEGQGGQNFEKLIPQFRADDDVEVGLDPRDDEGLEDGLSQTAAQGVLPPSGWSLRQCQLSNLKGNFQLLLLLN